MVNRARRTLPTNVRQVIARVAGIETTGTLQRVRLADGEVIAARLVIIATGQGYAVAKQLGIARREIRKSHSLTFGFDIEPAGDRPFRDSFLVYQRESVRDKIDYLAAFTLGSAMRVNLFTYREYKEDWTKRLIEDPGPGLRQVLPGLADVLGDFRAVGPVVARPIDLYVAENVRQDGVVLIGDAFQACCPATGMGMVRLLTDIEQLCTVHAPAWLATPGMGAGKIAAFYDDPVKRACDAKALHDSEYRRSVSTMTGLGWNVHRARVRLQESLQGWTRRAPARPEPPARAKAPAASFAPV
jgi:2-polyprenyl-6-methoxyphenol hydroxylase-like FAD-dependent oxidoreductase